MVVLALAAYLRITPDGSGIVVPGLSRHPTPPFCLMRLLTGVDCPGCGLTRSIVALMHGQLALGFRCHHLGPAVFVLLAAQIPYRLYYLRTKKPGPSQRTARLLCVSGAILAAALLADWAVRLPGQIAHPQPSVLFHRDSPSALGTPTARPATSPKESTHAHLHPH